MGRAAPGGRLPISFPRHQGQVPVYYARKATGRPAQPPPARFTARYVDLDASGPLYPFGFGLTYGRAAYGPTELHQETLAWDGVLTVSCVVAETAGADVEEVVQLYVRDLAASRVRPVRELKDFRKVEIPAGAETRVRFELRRADLGFADGAGGLIVEPGAFEVWIAPHAEAGQPARFTLEPPR